MVNYRLENRPSFEVVGRKTWISGQDNQIFGRFWEKCRAEGLFTLFEILSGFRPGAQTLGVTLGISQVEKDPAQRRFYYLIGVEKPATGDCGDLEGYQVPASLWAVFQCRGKAPDAIVEAEIFAFSQWLPSSGYSHAMAPEMEVYPAGESGDEYHIEFWLPITKIGPIIPHD